MCRPQEFIRNLVVPIADTKTEGDDRTVTQSLNILPVDLRKFFRAGLIGTRQPGARGHEHFTGLGKQGRIDELTLVNPVNLSVQGVVGSLEAQQQSQRTDTEEFSHGDSHG
ncbi:hypothetical protein SDC9_111180 [bioreactor metagenome]|uniref:Uncharacterized protein n=1 Tax=bioreactor metagenome TaxID=1076179 RepID=A0A645BR36_9ZZZZ